MFDGVIFHISILNKRDSLKLLHRRNKIQPLLIVMNKLLNSFNLETLIGVHLAIAYS